MPKISVIIPTYNRQKYVQEAIDSVLAQTYDDYEIVVVDDGSTDRTRQVLMTRYGDRIRYLRQDNQGESVARNRGIEAAQGEYIALLDSDDVWLPGKLARQMPVMDARPDVVLTFAQAWLIDADGQRLGTLPLCHDTQEVDLTLEALCLHNGLGSGTCTALIRRKAIEQVGGFDPMIEYGEDWDLWLRLRRQGPFAFTAEPLGCRRRHVGSQYRELRPQTMERRLSDYLRSLKRIFADWPGDVPQDLRERSWACRYASVAFQEYAIGRATSGRQRLSEAVRLDHEYWSDPQRLSERLIEEVLTWAMLTLEPVQVVIDRIRVAFDHWPSELPQTDAWRARVLSRVYAGLGFASYRARDMARTRYCFIGAIRHDPSWLRNRGVRSIIVEAFLGERFAEWLRGTVNTPPGWIL